MAEPAPTTGLPRFALRAYFVLGCAVLVGLVWVWPKYQARLSGLQTNYEGRVKGHEHRLRVQAEAVAEARREGREAALPPTVTWPVIVAGASLAIPCLALVFSLAVGRRRQRREAAAALEQPAGDPAPASPHVTPTEPIAVPAVPAVESAAEPANLPH